MPTSIQARRSGTVTPSPLTCWGVGDSITDAAWVPHDGNATWGVLSVGQNGAGWINTGAGYTIQTKYAFGLTFFGYTPKTIVCMGGVNDIRHSSLVGGADSSANDLKPYILSFVNARMNDGIRVIMATQPYWTHVYTSSSQNAQMAALNAWLLATFPGCIDAAGLLGQNAADSTDGLHPNITGSPKPSDTLSNIIRAGVGP